MASSMAPEERPSLPVPGEAAADPFVANAPGATHHRFSNFDHELFAAGPGSSPTQAKRALEAHLAETDRRLDEAGKLGTALVSQRKALAERLQEVEKLQKEGELGPDLRKKLVEIEREFNDLARESARVFLPKQRIPSNEANTGSPFVPEPRSGRRSVSPSKFESHATGSPTKLSVPNRKLRNQPSNRVHDIEFAAEISTSLIAQVRNLQTLLSEREEEVKTLQTDRAKLEIEHESMQQRLKALDESEHRYKEENWNLETRLQEHSSLQRDAADREKKLTQALGLSNAEKNTAQKELDEVKLSHAKLAEEHAATIKHHDIELGTAKRNMVMAEGERSAMQRKIDDLTSQNQELAKAFSLQRGRAMEREPASGLSDEEFDTAADNITPEHSPPPSPIKGTPRHAMLETETIKTSLQHAQRTIQSQRSQLHREKTEKLELRRIIQDLRDDLEKARTDSGSATASRRSRKVDSKEFKKSNRLLGSFRSSRQEIVVDDPDWEDNSEISPDTSDHFETANEASESAFETANERATETEEFQTGNEGFSDSDDDAATETESPSRGFGRMRRPPSLPAGLARHGNRDSFHSTASTSADEDEIAEMKTPTTRLPSQRSRVRLTHGSLSRSSRQTSEEPNLRSSPASFASISAAQPGQSLFAELQDFGGSDDDSLVIRRTLSPPPAVPMLPRVIMVDSGVMTDPVRITSEVFSESMQRPVSVQSVINPPASRSSGAWGSSRGLDADFSRPVSTLSYSDAGAQYEQDIGEKLAQFPVPPTSPPQMLPPTPPALGLSSIHSEAVEPREEPISLPTPPALRMSSLATQHVEPVVEPEAPAPVLSLSAIVAQGLYPVAEPDTPPPALSMTSLRTEAVEPVALPPPSLTFSTIAAEALEPREEPEPLARALPPIPQPPALSMSSIMTENVQPTSEPEIVVKAPPLSLSVIRAEELQPKEEPPVVPIQPPLSFSGIATEHVEPVAEVLPSPPTLAFSSIVAEHMHPVMEPPPTPPALGLSAISVEHVEPVSTPPRLPALPSFGFSSIETIETQPMSPRSPRRDGFILPRDEACHFSETGMPKTPPSAKMYRSAGSRANKNDSPLIAEDETRQSPREVPEVSTTPESQRPFKEISSNSTVRSSRKTPVTTSDQGAQTALTAGAIDKLLMGPPPDGNRHAKQASVDSVGSPDTTGTVRVYRSQESFDSLGRANAIDDSKLETVPQFRPGSAASGKGSVQEAPPLPSNHRQLIDAARSSSSRAAPGTMGPPMLPASALKQRPHTPSMQRPPSATSGRGTPTPRVVHASAGAGHTGVQSPTRLTARSRQSSVSSFASELDSRFNMRPGEMGIDPSGFGPNTDPRMIQAITQTMIGEFLWKYTRKTIRGEMSENRHRRYFWVHPYTRTLNWSDRDPSTAGRTELRAKSVPIEAVRVVTDDNPMPPGLHRKSLIIISPGRTIKFTCTTGQRHETWFNALSYLLLRTNQEGQPEVDEAVENITREDVDEFNPQSGQRRVPGNRPRAPASLSSYNSRGSRNESLALGMSMNVPTLTPSAQRQSTTSGKSSTGTFSKLSGYWKTGGPRLSDTISSLRGRGPNSPHMGIYEASEVHDSAEDLREMIERQDREAHRLENVRACCDAALACPDPRLPPTMGSWTALLVAYLLGGVTFIPLVIFAILVHGYQTFPVRDDVSPPDDHDGLVQPGDDTAPLEDAKTVAAADESKARAKQDLDVAAGYFAVCREYTPMGINAKPIERSTPLGSTTVAPPSPSVYQTMYRSIFDRKPMAGPLDNNSLSQRPKKAGNVFYVVLRHGHLMLFDDEEQLEVRHVISLAHHDISIYSGGDTTPEGELFIKRNALCLSRKRDKSEQTSDSQISKPFYLFSENCSAKEDFYFALLKNQEQTFGFDTSAPTPKQFDVKNIISLVQKLHSSEDHVHSRWLNAMLGRIFLAVYKTRDLENFIREKITKKISRVKRPSFLTNITIQKIDTGEAAPFFTNLKLRDLTVEGECVVEADVRYSGNFRIEVAATAKIDLGTRFKAREVNLVLAVVLRRVEGHVLFKVKAPPSNRVWLSFQTMPKMEMAIEPIVSSRQITYTVILRQIENRIKEVFAETLVQPFWDDVPFFKTEHKTWRGGIFEGDDAVESSIIADVTAEAAVDAIVNDRLEEGSEPIDEPRPLEKSQSLPVIDPVPERTGLFGRKLGKNSNSSSTSVVSTSVDSKPANSTVTDSKTVNASPLRSPTIVKNSTDPIVGTETAHADLFKPSSSPPDHATNYMAALQSRSQDASPMATPIGSPPKNGPSTLPSNLSIASSTEDAEADKQVEAEADTKPVPASRRNTASSGGSFTQDGSGGSSPTPSTTGSFKSQAGSLGRSFFMRRENTNNTSQTESSNGDIKRNTLAAVTNAAAQARQWGWNAIQRRQEAKRNGEKPPHVDLSQPMGRGQPLPPPGVPLPGPANGRMNLGPSTSLKRKPVSEQASTEASHDDKDSVPRSVQPPPLPQRRRRGASQEQEDEADSGQNMLVVAAPDDSQPGTPVAEEQVDLDAALSGHSTAAPSPPSVLPKTVQTAVLEAESDEPQTTVPEVKEHAPSPIMAMPAAFAVIDDDDDYSGWMDEELEEDTVEPLPEKAVGEAV
ncbi:anucleate primary sterigmata protein A [Purpureocillium lavendulum]|uniref:Anucleate primary sterigmata protein A n=1 Tax=Purpureocillium lavendulum TaxID=1247861 RepID=A0AB34FYF2_9HYPO|nr:anucleate primary sterigmata protein A [Purpureocillium lavendulum]